jgi:hypothetical protein
MVIADIPNSIDLQLNNHRLLPQHRKKPTIPTTNQKLKTTNQKLKTTNQKPP